MESARYIGYDGVNLPEDFGYGCGSLFYEDTEYGCALREVGVREDGPDAWGASVQVPPDSFVRRIGYDGRKSNWEFVTEEKTVWLTLAGSQVELVHIKPNGCLEWCIYRAVAR